MKQSQINKTQVILFCMSCSIFISGCSKDWLDAKPSQSLVLPNTIKDLQEILDNTAVFNQGQGYLGQAGCDEYYIKDANIGSLLQKDKNIYSWASVNNFYDNETIYNVIDWTSAYSAIFKANTILENIEDIKPSLGELEGWKNIKGSALFYRAYLYFNLSQTFCKPFIDSSANVDPGIVLRNEADINIKPTRSSVADTYQQIVKDLKESLYYLPNTGVYKTRPSKAAARGMLARVYLSKRDYENAFLYADSCLQLYNILLDFNSIVSPGTYTFTRFNSEVIFHSQLAHYSLLGSPTGIGTVDTTLLSFYGLHDLRGSKYFTNTSNRTTFRGSYTGAFHLFNGIATDEIYLIRAETRARKGDMQGAIDDLNTLLITRYASGNFTPLSPLDQTQTISLVLTERRKELCFRGVRWTDLRRLNLEPTFSKSISRYMDNTNYTLLPNNPKYTYPIPQSEILYSQIEQNAR